MGLFQNISNIGSGIIYKSFFFNQFFEFVSLKNLNLSLLMKNFVKYAAICHMRYENSEKYFQILSLAQIYTGATSEIKRTILRMLEGPVNFIFNFLACVCFSFSLTTHKKKDKRNGHALHRAFEID